LSDKNKKNENKKKKKGGRGYYRLVDNGERQIIREVKKFSERGAYVYIPNLWIGKRVEISLLI